MAAENGKRSVFLGPRLQEFESLEQQATFYLDACFCNWRNYRYPRSYIIPPYFENKNRESDEAEELVYEAINELIKEKIQAPFIAIHSLNINNLRTHLATIFPGTSWQELQAEKNHCSREYDFILIGPKIGIIVMEIKSTEGQQFKKRNGHLPTCYSLGLRQVSSVDALMDLLLKVCPIFSIPKISCKKILFFPNMERNNFDNWKKGSKKKRGFVKNKETSITHWFEEDVSNEDNDLHRPPVYSVLRTMLLEVEGIQNLTYETFAAVIAGMASISLSSLRPSRLSCIELDKGKFSTG